MVKLDPGKTTVAVVRAGAVPVEIIDGLLQLPTLEWLQWQVGGYIIPHPWEGDFEIPNGPTIPDAVVLVDEEGIPKNRPYNMFMRVVKGLSIRGTALIMSRSMWESDRQDPDGTIYEQVQRVLDDPPEPEPNVNRR